MGKVWLVGANIIFWCSLFPRTLWYCLGFLFPEFMQKRVLKKILSQEGLSRDDFRVLQPASYDERHPCVSKKSIALVPTSGSSGCRKLIPYTEELLDAFQNAIAPWLFCLYVQCPFLFWKKQYWIISPPVQDMEQDASGIPVKYLDDGQYFSALQCMMLRWILGDIEDKSLGCISVWSASILRSRVVRGHLGTAVLSSWADGGCKKKDALIVQKTLGIRYLQPKGVMATECVITTPLLGGNCCLAYTSHFFEFLDSQGVLCEEKNLHIGEVYELVITTQGGFYRYKIGDRLRVTGMFLGRPTWSFEERTQTVDLRGEKLSEMFVADVCEQVFPEYSTDPAFVLFAPHLFLDGDLGYVLYTDRLVTTSQLERLEAGLCQSHHYKQCRDMGQLLALSQKRIACGLERYIEVCQKRQGCRIGDVKISILSQCDPWNEFDTPSSN